MVRFKLLQALGFLILINKAATTEKKAPKDEGCNVSPEVYSFIYGTCFLLMAVRGQYGSCDKM